MFNKSGGGYIRAIYFYITLLVHTDRCDYIMLYHPCRDMADSEGEAVAEELE